MTKVIDEVSRFSPSSICPQSQTTQALSVQGLGRFSTTSVHILGFSMQGFKCPVVDSL